MMKISLFSFPVILLFAVFASCTTDPVVGSEDVEVLKDVRFVVDSTYVVNSEFRAMGKITNHSKNRLNPIWYVEGSFFTSSHKAVKLGGDNNSFSFALEAGQTTIWVLKYRNSNLDPEDYPDFTVSELRAYKKLDDE